MKNVKKVLITSLLGVAFSSVQAAETVIDFEDQNVIPFDAAISSLTIGDVVFEALDKSFIIDDVIFGAASGDATGKFLTNGLIGFNSLQISFTNEVSDFSFNLGGNKKPWTIEAFDSIGNSLTAPSTIAVLPQGNNNGAFFGLSSVAGISYATLTNTGVPDPFGLSDVVRIDNFTYNTIDAVTPPPVEPPPVSAVPEPSTYALMLGGLGLVGFMAARRRKNA